MPSLQMRTLGPRGSKKFPLGPLSRLVARGSQGETNLQAPRYLYSDYSKTFLGPHLAHPFSWVGFGCSGGIAGT